MKSRREMLEEFVAQDPNDSFSRYALALELEKEARPQDAVIQLREVIARDQDYVASYYHLGRLLTRSGCVDEARDVYRNGMNIASLAGDQKAASEIKEALEALD